MSPSDTAEIQRLLAHSSWVKSLATSLVGDPNKAEDLVQDTWLAALKERPRTDRPVRGWLATVLRNLVRQDARASSRRAGREEDAARDEALPSTLDLVERLARHREVVEAVEGLAEPYRKTLLLRYLEEHSPAEIARRSGVPVATVKTRLARGLEMLRARLDASDANGRPGWLFAWLPMIDRPGAVSAATLGTVLVSTSTKLALVLATLAVGTYAAWPPADREAPDSRAPGVAAAGPSTPALDDALPLDDERRSGERVPVPVPEEPAPERTSQGKRVEPIAAAPGPVSPLRGLVLDAEGRSAGRVALRFLPGGRRPSSAQSDADAAMQTTSGADGSFVFEGTQGRGTIVDDDERLVTVMSGVDQGRHGSARPVVVVANRHPVSGRVIDETGQPIDGAHLRTAPPAAFRSRFAEVMDYSADVPNEVETDADGRFELQETPWIDGSTLNATFEGLAPHVEPLPETPGADLVIVMHRLAVTSGSLRGRVLDASGAGVPGASVAYGVERGSTDEYGFFEFDMENEDSVNRFVAANGGTAPRRLIALKSGYQPARLDVAPLDTGDELIWPDVIELRLGDPPLTLAGTVVDERDTPLPGIRVWVADPTLFAFGREGAVVLESELAGNADSWTYAETDASGRFELRGLTDRSYELGAMDMATLARTSGSADAGRTDARLVLDSGRRWKRVAGRIVDRAGEPLPGIAVAPVTDSFRLRYQTRVVSTRHSRVEEVLTDEEGRFELFEVPEELVYLRLDGEDIISMDYGRTAPGGLGALHAGELEDMKITAGVRVHLQVELEDPTEADELAILDESGERITINIIRGPSRSERPRAPLAEGRSDTLTVHDGARTLVLYKDSEELRRKTLELSRGEINRVRL